MAFAINILKAPVPKDWLKPGENAVLAEITIGDFRERFAINTDYWSLSDYVAQWVESIERLLKGGEHTKSILVTQMYDSPEARYTAMCWVLYKEKNLVYVQNYFEASAKMKHPINIEELYERISDRKGEASEWTVSLSELRDWHDELRIKRTFLYNL